VAIEQVKIKILKGAEEIAGFIKEDVNQIPHLVKDEGLPAWKRTYRGPWRALDIDLCRWLLSQRKKYLKDTPKYI
jgi:hypothetical protein